jgi:hypothetical protein
VPGRAALRRAGLLDRQTDDLGASAAAADAAAAVA